MGDTYFDREVCIFLVPMLKTVTISFIDSKLVITLYSVGFLSNCSGNNNTSLLLYASEVIHFINKGVISPHVQELGGILLKFNILSSLCSTLLHLNWMSAFLKQPWSNTKSTLCTIWENNLETFEKLFSTIQSRCSIYCYFLKPLPWDIHELWHQAFTVMKITVEDFKKIVFASHIYKLVRP